MIYNMQKEGVTQNMQWEARQTRLGQQVIRAHFSLSEEK